MKRMPITRSALTAAVIAGLCASPAFAQQAPPPKPQPPAISAEFPYEHKFVEVLGSRIAYAENGEGNPILVNAKPSPAGTEGVFAPFAELEDEHYDLVFERNVRGVFNSMRHEAKAMLAQGVGVIINNASAAAPSSAFRLPGFMPLPSMPCWA